MDCCKDKINISVYFDSNHNKLAELFAWCSRDLEFYRLYNGQWVKVYTGGKNEVSEINLKLAMAGIRFKNEITTLK